MKAKRHPRGRAMAEGSFQEGLGLGCFKPRGNTSDALRNQGYTRSYGLWRLWPRHAVRRGGSKVCGTFDCWTGRALTGRFFSSRRNFGAGSRGLGADMHGGRRLHRQTPSRIRRLAERPRGGCRGDRRRTAPRAYLFSRGRAGRGEGAGQSLRASGGRPHGVARARKNPGSAGGLIAMRNSNEFKRSQPGGGSKVRIFRFRTGGGATRIFPRVPRNFFPGASSGNAEQPKPRPYR